MKAVYPYIHSDRDEIRYSIRSLVKYSDCEPVIIGDRPDWYTGDHIPFPNDSHNKITNVYFKLYRACLEFERFFLMNDDIFLLEPLKRVHYTNGTLEELYLEYKATGSYYSNAIQRTLEVASGRNYETHTPMYIVSKTFLAMPPEWFIIDPALFRTCYGHRSKTKVVDMKRGDDVRRGEAKFYQELKGERLFKWIDGLPCFSTPDKMNICEELRTLYHEPTKYES